jgi:hypothetical protein
MSRGGTLNIILTEEPAVYLKESFSTLEESRANLAALRNFFGPKLIEIRP